MATKSKATPLSSALNGSTDSLTANQTKTALGQAVDKITGLTKKAGQSKDSVMKTGSLVLHTAENQGTLFLASMAEGFFGEDKLKVGGLDLRAPTAVVAQGYGLYETLSGRKGGGHALAIGNGLLGSWLASVAVKAGRTLREKRNAPTQQPQTQAQPQPQPQQMVMVPTTQGAQLLEGPTGIPESILQGPVREVLLTPEPSAQGEEELAGRRTRRSRGGGGSGGRRRHRDEDEPQQRRRPPRSHRNRFYRPDEGEDDGE